jgi:hypothetical protein
MFDQSIPPISALLMREAEAWRALLGLHAGVVGTARQMATAVVEHEILLEGARESIEQREAAYYASLTQLAANCDALSTEALRIRSLRKARASTDTQALQVLMQAHSSETLAIGTTLGSNSATSVQAVTAELRQATQATRQQIAQMRALMQAIQDTPEMRGSLGLTFTDENTVHQFCIDDVFNAVYQEADELHEESLVAAMKALCAPTEEKAASGETAIHSVPATRMVVRRQGDRGAR